MGRACRIWMRWLEPFLAALGHKKRRLWAPLYLRGLLGPSERKSLQPMAASLGLSGHDQLQHFIASPAWDDAPLWRVLAEQADRLVGGPEAVLVIDDTALPKKGTLSVGVARQYCGQLGKRANCQVLVSLTLAGREVPVPVGLRLFLPEEWTAIRSAARRPACRRTRWRPEPRARSRWPRWTGSSPPACGSASCWPTPATAQRRLPPGLERARADLGGRHPAQPEGLSADVQLVPPTGPQAAPGAGPGAPRGRGGAG